MTRKLAIAFALLMTACSGANVVEPVGLPPPEGTVGGSSASASSSSGSGSTSTSGSSSGSGSGTTGAIGDGSLCSPCTQDTDCGEVGLALCDVTGGSGVCLPSCSDDSDCDAAAQCTMVSGQQVCFPRSGTCEGFVPLGPPDAGDGSTSDGSSGSSGSLASSSSSGSGSSSASSSSSGSTTSSTTTGGSTSSSTTTGGTSSSSTTTTTTGSSGTTGTGVGVHGGTVNRMHFLITGDTRPPACDDTAHYPTTIMNKIADAATANNVQFALDMGDHMFVCNNHPATANAQMQKYMQSISRYHGAWFMTEGNHECMAGGSNGHCPLSSTNANYLAFLDALSPIASKPYYKIDVQTSQGLARFVFVGDNSWTSAQQTWLENTLSYADTHAKYTIIVKHHPAADTSVAANATIMGIIRSHKFALLLTGHAHEYRHPTSDHGREIVMGLGGAPLHGATNYHGYALVDQHTNGNLRVTVYSLATGAATDSWAVPPN